MVTAFARSGLACTHATSAGDAQNHSLLPLIDKRIRCLRAGEDDSNTLAAHRGRIRSLPGRSDRSAHFAEYIVLITIPPQHHSVSSSLEPDPRSIPDGIFICPLNDGAFPPAFVVDSVRANSHVPVRIAGSSIPGPRGLPPAGAWVVLPWLVQGAAETENVLFVVVATVPHVNIRRAARAHPEGGGHLRRRPRSCLGASCALVFDEYAKRVSL